MAKHQQHATVTDSHSHPLAKCDFAFVKHPSQQQYQGGIEIQNESLKRGADVLQA